MQRESSQQRLCQPAPTPLQHFWTFKFPGSLSSCCSTGPQLSVSSLFPRRESFWCSTPCISTCIRGKPSRRRHQSQSLVGGHYPLSVDALIRSPASSGFPLEIIPLARLFISTFYTVRTTVTKADTCLTATSIRTPGAISILTLFFFFPTLADALRSVITRRARGIEGSAGRLFCLLQCVLAFRGDAASGPFCMPIQ
jgi:hypothetical protein